MSDAFLYICPIWLSGEFEVSCTPYRLAFIPWPRHNSCRKGVCGNVWFLYGWLDVCNHLNHRSWDKSKNPCESQTFANPIHHHYLESTQRVASCFPSPDDAPHLEMCDFHMGMGSCYIIEVLLIHIPGWSTSHAMPGNSIIISWILLLYDP